MARTEAPKAGKYEQLVDRYDEYNDKNELVATYEKGDIVPLTAEQAERLTTGDRPAFAEPGALAAAEAARLQAQADALKAQAEDAKARAADASKDASKDAKAPAADASKDASKDAKAPAAS
jgi:colicin import membrane protein